MGSFFSEFKRRHIYRVAAAYAVVAWVLLQLVANVAPILELPPWVARALLLLLVIGFPLAILLAWAREPEGDASQRAMTGGLVLVIALVAYQELAPADRTVVQSGVDATRAAANSPATALSIAVLPFSNLSSDPEQEFFSDGITEEITAALAKISDLRVVARTSAFQFKGENRDMRAPGFQPDHRYRILSAISPRQAACARRGCWGSASYRNPAARCRAQSRLCARLGVVGGGLCLDANLSPRPPGGRAAPHR